MRIYKHMIVQEKMGQLLHKVWPKQCTRGHETQFGDGAAMFIPGRSLWVSYDGGSHSVLQVFQTICSSSLPDHIYLLSPLSAEVMV